MNDAPIYLEKIGINDFRTFGEFQLELSPEPGVTILWGPNGLGKTNFFNALEWALTGKVERLQQAKGNAQEKSAALRRDGRGQPLVNLLFSDGLTISRGESVVTPVDFANRLMTEGWPGSEFSAAFRFTHLLDQSAGQHFVRMEDNERWTYVGGLTRLREVWDIQRKLGANFTKELHRLEEQAREQLANVEAHKSRLTELRRRRDRLHQLARAAKMVTPEEAIEACDRMMGRLKEALGLTWSISSPDNAAERIADLATAITRLAEQWRSWRSSLDLRHGDVERYLKLTAAVSESKTRIEVAEEEWNAASLQADSARAEVLTKDQEQQVCSTRRDAASRRHTQLRELQSLEQYANEHARLCGVFSSRLRETADRRQAIESEIDLLRPALATAEAAAKAVADAGHRLSHASALLSQVQALGEAERLLHDKENVWQDASLKVMDLQTRMDALSARIDILKAQSAEANWRRDFARQRAGIIQGAVAAIAEALNEDACRCPVCMTQHDGGRLKVLAKAAASEGDPALAALEEEEANRRVEIEQLTEEQARISENLRQLDSARVALENARDTEQRLFAQLVTAPEFVGATREALPMLAQDGLLQAQVVLAQATAHAQTSGAPTVLRASLSSRSEHLASVEREEAEARAAFENAEASVHEARLRAAALSEALGLNDNWPSLLPQAIAESAQGEELAARLLREADEAVSEARVSMDAVNRRLEEIRQQRSQLEAERQAYESEVALLLENWRRSRLPEPISSESLRAAVLHAETSLSELAGLAARQEDLARGLAAWNSAEELRRDEQSIAAWVEQAKCGGEDELSKMLEDEVERITQRLSRLAELEHDQRVIRDKVRNRNQLIQERALRPLNGLLNSFMSALVTDQSHEMRLECRFGAGAGAGVRARNMLGNDVIPDLYLSEGQLGAVNLSLLLSANLTYPWSRWPALLLDDPLQYSDIINTSAFLDVICNLVEERGYQVILSTHDSSEADFCRRKLLSAGIRTNDCQLLAHSADGVRYRCS